MKACAAKHKQTKWHGNRGNCAKHVFFFFFTTKFSEPFMAKRRRN